MLKHVHHIAFTTVVQLVDGASCAGRRARKAECAMVVNIEGRQLSCALRIAASCRQLRKEGFYFQDDGNELAAVKRVKEAVEKDHNFDVP